MVKTRLAKAMLESEFFLYIFYRYKYQQYWNCHNILLTPPSHQHHTHVFIESQTRKRNRSFGENDEKLNNSSEINTYFGMYVAISVLPFPHTLYHRYLHLYEVDIESWKYTPDETTFLFYAREWTRFYSGNVAYYLALLVLVEHSHHFHRNTRL